MEDFPLPLEDDQFASYSNYSQYQPQQPLSSTSFSFNLDQFYSDSSPSDQDQDPSNSSSPSAQSNLSSGAIVPSLSNGGGSGSGSSSHTFSPHQSLLHSPGSSGLSDNGMGTGGGSTGLSLSPSQTANLMRLAGNSAKESARRASLAFLQGLGGQELNFGYAFDEEMVMPSAQNLFGAIPNSGNSQMQHNRNLSLSSQQTHNSTSNSNDRRPSINFTPTNSNFNQKQNGMDRRGSLAWSDTSGFSLSALNGNLALGGVGLMADNQDGLPEGSGLNQGWSNGSSMGQGQFPQQAYAVGPSEGYSFGGQQPNFNSNNNVGQMNGQGMMNPYNSQFQQPTYNMPNTFSNNHQQPQQHQQQQQSYNSIPSANDFQKFGGRQVSSQQQQQQLQPLQNNSDPFSSNSNVPTPSQIQLQMQILQQQQQQQLAQQAASSMQNQAPQARQNQTQTQRQSQPSQTNPQSDTESNSNAGGGINPVQVGGFGGSNRSSMSDQDIAVALQQAIEHASSAGGGGGGGGAGQGGNGTGEGGQVQVQMQWNQMMLQGLQNGIAMQNGDNTTPESDPPSPIRALTNADAVSLRRSASSSGAVPSSKPAKAKADPEKLHNIVEQRYRKNVKGSLEMLRDTVPRLRHLYGTSTELQSKTTDIEIEGKVCGVEDLGKPTKKTVMEGARKYIVYLEREMARQNRRADYAENFISAAMGQTFDSWKHGANEWLRQEQVEPDRLAAAEEKRLRSVYLDEAGSDEEDEDEEEEKPKKRKRPSGENKPAEKKAITGKPASAKKARKSAALPGAGVVLSSFSVAYTFFPKATSVFTSSSAGSNSSATHGRVLAMDTPLKVATHSSAFLARALPQEIVPHPDDLMDWTMLIVLAIGLTALTWYVLERFIIGSAEEREVAAVAEHRLRQSEMQKAIQDGQIGDSRLRRLLGVGSVRGVAADALLAAGKRVGVVFEKEDELESRAWLQVLASAVGSYSTLPRLSSLHLRLHMAAQNTTSPSQLALDAFLAPTQAESVRSWSKARQAATYADDVVASTVTALPLRDARNLLNTVKPTAYPLQAIANQSVIIHLSDLTSKIYTTLMESTCGEGKTTLKGMSKNLQSPAILQLVQQDVFKAEVQDALIGVPRGTEGYALGLVLIGLWGLLAGQDAEARRELATLLAGEQTLGVASNFSSVTTLLSILAPAYRPSGLPLPSHLNISEAAQDLDTLVTVCLHWISLLASAPRLALETAPRLERLASSKKVKEVTLNLRVLLAHPAFRKTFEGAEKSSSAEGSSDEASNNSSRPASINGEGLPLTDVEVEVFDKVTYRLVEVLTVLGKKAGERASGRDEDSGVEGDLDEL